MGGIWTEIWVSVRSLGVIESRAARASRTGLDWSTGRSWGVWLITERNQTPKRLLPGV